MRVAVFALSLALLASVAAAMTPVEIKREYGDAVVMISTYSAAEDAVGLGSGFIVDPSGVIVTCYHVIDGANPAVVKLLNGASFQDIWVLGCDSARDVAVIKVKGRGLPAVKLGNSDDVEVGERLVAIGNPKGLENTVSDGLLSGVRELDGYSLLQMSAPISPGSSGGPVFNSSGRVVGIAAATLRDGQNLNFCVPIKYAREYTDAEPHLTLEEFSRGVRSAETGAALATSGGSRREFLRALIPVLGSFWMLRFRMERFYRQNPNEDKLLVELALAREKAQTTVRKLEELKAPNADLQRILQRYTGLARRFSEAYDIMLRSFSPKDKVMFVAGYAKFAGVTEELKSSECLDILVRDLALQYFLDAGVEVKDLGRKLPSVFDSLPAIIVIGAECAVLELRPKAAPAEAIAAADKCRLGFNYPQDEPRILVDTIFEGSQAEKAGLRRGDVITGANDSLRFGNIWDWDMFRATQPIDETFVLNILRNGSPMRLKAALSAR